MYACKQLHWILYITFCVLVAVVVVALSPGLPSAFSCNFSEMLDEKFQVDFLF